jgi:hypothetical protein
VPFLEPWVTKVTEDTVGLQTYKLGLKVIWLKHNIHSFFYPYVKHDQVF